MLLDPAEQQFDCSICQRAVWRTAISTAGRSRSLEMRVITLSRLTRMPSQEDQQPLSGEHDLGVVDDLEPSPIALQMYLGQAITRISFRPRNNAGICVARSHSISGSDNNPDQKRVSGPPQSPPRRQSRRRNAALWFTTAEAAAQALRRQECTLRSCRHTRARQMAASRQCNEAHNQPR